MAQYRKMLKTADVHIDLHSFPEVPDYERPTKCQTSAGVRPQSLVNRTLGGLLHPEITDSDLVEKMRKQ